MENQKTKSLDKTNELLPASHLLALGLQHVLAMYAGAVAVPLIIGSAIGLSTSQVAFLVAADLFACGIATLIQSFGIGRFIGIRVPAILGTTFAVVGTLTTIGRTQGMQIAFGSVIAGGLIVFLIAPLWGKLVRFFPQIVSGTVVTIIGLSLIPVGITNAAGGNNSPDFGEPINLVLAGLVIVLILLMNKFFKGFLQSLSVLIGLVVGTVVASMLGMVDMTPVYSAKWVSIIKPFAFGLPQFELSSIFMMSMVMMVVMIESTGAFFAIGQICGKELQDQDIVKGIRAEGLATIFSGIFNSFPHSTFSQNIGLLALSKITSRFVVITSGLILIALGLIPKFSNLATIIPAPVFGGATIIMFAMVAVSGINILKEVDFTKNTNMLVVATSIGLGLGVSVVPGLLDKTPEFFRNIFESGIVTGSITAVLLNTLLNWKEVLGKKN